MKRSTAMFSALCALLAAICACRSVAEGRPLVDFKHTAWTEQNGAPTQINALAQTRDGYLWLGTVTGLYRFDGVTFEAYQPPHGQKSPAISVWSLAATNDGGLWIGYTKGGTSFLKDGVLTNQPFHGNKYMRKGGTVFSILVRRDGSTWAATYAGLAKLEAGVWHLAEEAEGTEVRAAFYLFEDSRQTMWITTDEHVYRLPYGANRIERTTLNSEANTYFSETPDGVVWIADRSGVRRLTEPPLRNGTYRAAIQVKDETAAGLLLDDTGALWFLGGKTGITRIDQPDRISQLLPSAQQGSLDHFSIGDGLSSESGSAVLKDREGTIWVATTAGLDRFRRSALTPTPLPSSFGRYPLAAQADGSILVGTQFEGLYKVISGRRTKVSTGVSEISCVYHAPDGRVWIGGTAQLGYLQAGKFTGVPVPPEFKQRPRHETQSMTTGADGDPWVQADSALGIYRLHQGVWSEVPNTNSEYAHVMATDSAGRVWAGRSSGNVSIFDGTKRTNLKDLPTGVVLALTPFSGGMWIGGEQGLVVMTGDHIQELKLAGETRIRGISGILRIEDGSLWLNTLAGVLRVPSDEVDQALKNPSHPMQYRLFDFLDGLSGKAPQIRMFPSIVRGVGTTLWFTTTDGIVSLDTANIPSNAVVPPVSIKNVVADGHALDITNSIALPKGSRDLEVNYTALSLAIPERVHFRYRLEGYDKDWQDAGTRRQAFYTHLPPGHYTFRVIACNNDGLWNETGAALPLYLPPTFLQSWYFQVLLVLLFLILTWLIYLLRMRRETASIQARLQERLSERERIARELHDTLFQSVEGSLLHLNAITSRLVVEEEAREHLRQAYGEVDRVMGQARSLVFDLRQPVDAQDIGATIRLFAEEVGALSDAQVEVQVRGPYIELKPTTYNEVLKIIKECIWNAFRHARSHHIKIEINSSSRAFEVSVKDDGVGIDPTILETGQREGHWGLPGIRERAAKLKAKLFIRNGDMGGAEVLFRIKAAEAYRSSRGFFSWHWRALWSDSGKR